MKQEQHMLVLEWLEQKQEWKTLCCIGAIHTEFESKKGKSNEWHYYISSRPMSPQQLLHHARMGMGCRINALAS